MPHKSDYNGRKPSKAEKKSAETQHKREMPKKAEAVKMIKSMMK